MLFHNITATQMISCKRRILTASIVCFVSVRPPPPWISKHQNDELGGSAKEVLYFSAIKNSLESSAHYNTVARHSADLDGHHVSWPAITALLYPLGHV